MGSNSSSSGSGQAVISLDSQAAVTALLSSIRASELSSGQKNELRDLVFLYTNGGHDAGVLSALEQKIRTYGITIESPRKRKSDATKDEAQPTIGKIRKAPVFSVPATKVFAESSQSAEPKSEPNNAAPEVVTPAVSNAAPSPEPPVASPSASTPSIQPEPPAPAAQPASVTPAPQMATTQVDENNSKSGVTETSSSANPVDENLERIREIKALVNEKVGNPVNLVELNPDVGREYMSALLEAMKKVNSGASSQSAMERLEAAYKTVASIDPANNASNAVGAEQTLPTPPPTAAQTAPATPTGGETKTSAPQPVPPTPEPVSAPTSEPESASATPTQQRPVPVADVNQVVTNLNPAKPVVPTPPPTAAQTAPVRSEPIKPVAETPAYVPTPTTEPANATASDSTVRGTAAPVGYSDASAVTPATNPSPITPLSALKNPLADNKVSTSATETPATPADPLHTPAIDNGLQQLLEEWPIFKKSGLFGTGPKGREHPLFKKVSGLQIPLLLAGRFEGANQEIKQSITDYMNGWRYEQGIIYEHGETFEHYLRRVIKHILDLQKGRV